MGEADEGHQTRPAPGAKQSNLAQATHVLSNHSGCGGHATLIGESIYDVELKPPMGLMQMQQCDDARFSEAIGIVEIADMGARARKVQRRKNAGCCKGTIHRGALPGSALRRHSARRA